MSTARPAVPSGGTGRLAPEGAAVRSPATVGRATTATGRASAVTGRAGTDRRRAEETGLSRNGLVLIVLCVAALAWLVVAVVHAGHAPTAVPDGGGSPAAVEAPGRSHAGHGASLGGDGIGVLTGGLLAVVGWTFMVVAMMLPPALPLLDTVRRLVAGRADAVRLTYLAALGFVAMWAGIGVLLVAGDIGLRALWTGRGWAAAPAPVAVGVVLMAAGVFQLTPLKDACLTACRSPRSFALAHWRGQRPAAAEVTAISRSYSLACVGCCWALMLVCFAVGAAAMPAMVGLALLMAAERLVPWGRRLVKPAGLLLIVLGVLSALEVSVHDFLP